MSSLWVHPALTHTLAVAIRFVDPFTGRPVDERLEVRLEGQERWIPTYGPGDSSYRFSVSNAEIPALGPTAVHVSSLGEPARYVYRRPLVVDIPRLGAPPTPLGVGYHLVVHELEPSRAFRPPPGETAIRGLVVRAGQPQGDLEVRVGVGGAPGPATPIVHTDADGEFVYRLPGATAAVNPPNIVATAALQFAVAAGGVAQPIANPPMPLAVPVGRTTSVLVQLV